MLYGSTFVLSTNLNPPTVKNMEQDDCHVIQVLRSKNFYETLRLTRNHEAPSFCTIKNVRRKYKEIALFVHPDRNRSQRAEEAFKKVGEAYECLVDETSQMLYLNSIIKSNKNDGSFVKKKVPSSVKRKRSDYNEETTFKSKKSFVRRMRTPKEIWEAFQREEEEMARENFHEKGFDRIFNDDLETTGNNMDKSPILDEATKSKVLESNLDKKATEWMRWSSSCSSSSTREFEELEQKNACCLLCRRRFRSVEHLERHEMLSEMHKANVSAKQKAVQSPNTSNR